MLLWIFGEVKNLQVKTHSSTEASGLLELERANVQWQFGIDAALLPGKKSKTHKVMQIDSDEIDFSEDGENLHTSVYKEILDGNGVGLFEAKQTIELLHKIRKAAN